MSPLADTANAIIALATLAALLCLFYGPWQAVCTDISRQIIFERRDHLFDMALAGRIDFDTAAYRAARRTLNGLLRVAHRLTWQEFIISAYFIERNKPKIQDWRETLVGLPADVREEVEGLVRECSAMLVGLMAMKSIFIGPIVFIVAFLVACTKGSSWLLRSVASQAGFDPLNEKIQTSSAEFAETEMALAA
jgi:hypothetical protein